MLCFYRRDYYRVFISDCNYREFNRNLLDTYPFIFLARYIYSTWAIVVFNLELYMLSLKIVIICIFIT